MSGKDTFFKTLHSVLTGTRHVEEFAHVLVSSAVEDALLCVARDYGHEYTVLLKRYKDVVVDRHANGTLVEKNQCRGTTKGGKQCGKRGILHGYCQQHAVQMAEEECKRRKVQAYASSIPTVDMESLTMRLLLHGKPVIPTGVYKVV